VFKRGAPRAEGQRRFRDRRRTKRQLAGWESQFRVVDEEREHLHFSGDDFGPCVLFDLSMEGAGLELTDGEVEIGDRVELDLQLAARGRASIKVRGEVRHWTTSSHGNPRAGLRFLEVGNLERALLLRLLRDLDRTAARSA
jgi:c-di-GMP-binding flagellar brake protein YcgR